MRRSHCLILLIGLVCLTACAAPQVTPALAVPQAANTAAVRPAPASPPSPTSAPAPASGLVARQVYDAALRPQVKDQIHTEGMTEYRLTVDLASDLSQLSGQEEISYTNREAAALDAIYLHLYPNLWSGGMTVSDAQVAGRPVTLAYPTGDDAVGLPLDPPLQPGDSVALALRFAVPIPSGEGVGNYGEFALGGGVLALAHFYPTVAVRDAGGWRLETPAPHGDVVFHDASLYDVTLTGPANLTVVSTGALLGRTEGPDGAATWRLGGGPLRDFNIIASAAYRSANTQVGDVIVNSYFLPDDEAGGKQALDWAAEALVIYQKEFGAYPYRELDVAATATSALGIEYPGLVAIAGRLYGDPERQQYFESATAHEVAHQWWYNVVGNDQVNDPWLDEALAQYSTYLYYRDRYGAPGGQGYIEAMRSRWARVDNAEIPIGLPVAAYSELQYGAIVYGRGPLFLLALADRLGAEKMTELLRRYYAGETWKIATPSEFRALAEDVAGTSLEDLFVKWVGP